MSEKFKGNIMLLLTALIWGIAFVAQSDGMNYVGPFTYGASRYLIGGTALIPVIAVFGKSRREHVKEEAPLKTTVIGGICCGTALFVAGSFQQFGIMYTTVGKAGFITALYIIIVPLIQFVIYRRSSLKLWLCTAAAIVGFYLLCINGDSGVSYGDLLVLACALFFAFHIMVIDRFNAKNTDGVLMSCIQFFTAGMISLVFMLICEQPVVFSDITAAWLPILYGGVMSSGVAYTLQILGQRHTDPITATLIMSLESVFSALAGWLLLGETLSIKELSGCALVFAAVVAAQIDIPFRKSGAPDNKTERSGIRKDTGKEDEKGISE